MTGFIIATAISTAVLVLSIVIAVYIARLPYRGSRLATPSRVLAVGVFFSGWTLYFPYYFYSFAGQNIVARLWEALWVSAHHTIRLFVIDTDFSEIFNSAMLSSVEFYAVLGTILFILAPIMTAGVILSFFRNFVSYMRCMAHRGGDAYIFSDLSPKSLALATDLQKNHKNAVIIFTDIFDKEEEENFELVERAREMGAVCFREDVASINLSFFSKNSRLSFFAIGADESENVRQAYALTKANAPCAKRDNVFLYVFSKETESELLLSNLPETKIQIRRIDDIRSLVWRTLYDGGEDLFSNAMPNEDGTKTIRAFVIGTGGHGTAIIRTLAWFCQMDGYRIEIHAFDRDARAEERFAMIAPELMSPANNGVYIAGEAQYKIVFHAGVSVNDTGFSDALATAGTPTSVFVSMGNDALNVRTAVYLRQHFRQKHLPDPIIRAIVYDTENKKVLNGAHNWKNQPFNIQFIGDLEEMYSERVILKQDLEEEALGTHRSYGGGEEDFYRYEYNYSSSMASALHRHLRRKLGIASFNKPAEELTEEERDTLERIEHNRWNAYMRSEGYVYSGSPDAKSRDDLAKMHHNLIPFDQLSEEDKRKDSIVGAGRKK